MLRSQNGNFVDEAGKRYGKLVVIERIDRIAREGGTVKWLCQCDCGNVSTVRAINLRNGNTKSCGCLRKLPDGESSFNKFIATTKKHAKQRGYSWELSIEQVRTITKRNCFYCGRPPSQKYNIRKYEHGEYVYNGIDRIDNSRGYVEDNVVPCCGVCNWMKSNLSVDDFVEIIRNIYNHFVMSHLS